MSDLQELVSMAQAEQAVVLLAWALPVVGTAIGAGVGLARRRAGRGALAGLGCGLSGPGLWLLWRLYNSIVGVYGLDSVRGLLVNLALFLAIGVAVGTIAARLRRVGGGGA